MKNIDVIRTGTLSKIIGPSGTMKRIIKNRDYFLSRGYNINIFTNDSINTGKSNYIPINKPAVSKGKRPFYKKYITTISKKARLFAKKNKTLAKFYIRLSEKRTKKLIEFYLSLKRTPDIVVLHSEMETSLFFDLCKNPPKVVTFLHSDGSGTMLFSYYPCLKGEWGDKHILSYLRKTIAKVDKLVFISKLARNSFKKSHPDFPLSKIGLDVNGIEDLTDNEKRNLLNIKGRYNNFKYRLVCTGTINRRKGQWLVIDALSKTKQEIREKIHISFIGDGPEKNSLEEKVKKLGLNENITFEGSIKNEEIYSFLAEHNIFILMSENEGLPISIIEAMRLGLPIISTNVAGIPETVDQNGILLDVSEDQLIEVLNNVDNYNWEEMGKKSRIKFENDFLFSRMAKDYCDIMDSLYT